MMKMPILLSGHTMTPAGILRPQSMSLNLRTDGLSSASIVLDEDNPDVGIGAWVQIWAPNGEMCVMYVKNRKKDYITGLVTLSLEHTFGLLQAMVVFGEVTAATMAGSASATTCTVTQAITYLLNQQTESLWTLYSCDFNDAQGWKFTNSDIYNDLNSLTDAIQDCQWEFDQSYFPWRLSLKAWPVSSTMEMRRNRNLESLKVTQDRSGMYTRVYPTGKNNLHIDSVNSNVSYLDRNTQTYGVIAQVITDSTIGNAALLKAWAEKQLKKNAEPKYTVSITGYDLSASTNEPMDHFVIGRLCRIPLPEYGVTVTERLTELSWKDTVNKPDEVTCTLANELKTITGVLNEQARGGGGGGKKANTEHDCELGEDEEKIEEFENADIWINRDSVWAVCGSYTVVTSASGKKLIVNDGTALVLERNHTEYGVYDEGSLTGGIIVDKVNGQTGQAITRILGTLIVIGNDQSIDADYRGKTLDGTLTAITSDFTSVNTLLAQKIEATDINAQTVTAAAVGATFSGVSSLSATTSIGCTGPISGTEIWSGGSRLNLIDASVSNDGKTLTITRASGAAINFTSGGSYNDGWNDCVDDAAERSHNCLTGYTSWNNGSSSTLYYYDTSSLSYKVASGSARYWKYGGTTHTYYSLPDKKT